MSPLDKTCHGCGQPIIWAWTDRGRQMPLDPEPSGLGDRAVTELPDGRVARPSMPWDPLQPGEVRMRRHAETCPERGKRKSRTERGTETVAGF